MTAATPYELPRPIEEYYKKEKGGEKREEERKKEELISTAEALEPGQIAPETIEVPSYLTEFYKGPEEIEALEKENTLLKEQLEKVAQEAEELFSQLQKKYGRGKWNKEDALYEQWRLTRGQVMQLEKLIEINKQFIKINAQDRRTFKRLYKENLTKGGKLDKKWAEEYASEIKTNLEIVEAQRENLREIIQNTEYEKNLASFWNEAQKLVGKYLEAKRSNNQDQMERAENGLLNFIRSIKDKKILWELTGRFAKKATLAEEAQKETTLLGRLKKLFSKEVDKAQEANEEYNLWEKLVEPEIIEKRTNVSPALERARKQSQEPPVKIKDIGM
jgi:hypothetical protein